MKEKITVSRVAREVEAEFNAQNADVTIEDVTHDSRAVKEGVLFVAIKGASADGNAFIRDVMRRGAAGVISEQQAPPDFVGAWLKVPDARKTLAHAAACVHRHPSRELDLIGITGTNGKTTCAFLIAAILEAAKNKIALMGTIEQRIGQEKQKAIRTTPEASETNRFLRRAVDAGCVAAVMECSSQALDLRRCEALQFAVAAWTNLTPDHLDYHPTMEDYFKAKRKLFDASIGTRPRAAVVNLDDDYGRRLRDELKDVCWTGYAIKNKGDVMARDIEISLRGMRLTLDTPHGRRELTTPLIGVPHVSNILLATAVAQRLNIDLDVIAHAIRSCTGAPGRFEPVPHTAGEFVIVVDYAHTEDALINTLQTGRELVKAHNGRVVCVFGCGGDRDTLKRAPMGKAACELSDIVIATSDNPRHENPETILADIEQGMKQTGKPYLKITDRRAAIHHAVNQAQDGDIIIIAGKGHEDYQVIGDAVLPFSDREVAREAAGDSG